MKIVWQTTVLAVALAVLLSVFTLTSSASQLLGDVDQNGKLNSADVRVMLHYMFGSRSFTAQERQIADCDGNGRIDTRDARYVLVVVTQGQTPSTLPTTTTTVVTTTTTKPSLDDEGYYDDIVKP